MARADSKEAAMLEKEVGGPVEDAEKMSAKTTKKATKKSAKEPAKKAARKSPAAATKSKSAAGTKTAAAKAKPRKAKTSSTARPAKRATASASTRPRKSNGREKPSIAASAWNRQEIPEQKQFFLCSGQRLRNIEELADVLDEMQKEIFEYHVNSERNDIHAWVKDVFREEALADDLLGAGNARQMRDVIRRYAPEGA